eukprot:SAG22_NODE_8204_length_675_cov_0.782986_1_plen_106_part_01
MVLKSMELEVEVPPTPSPGEAASSAAQRSQSTPASAPPGLKLRRSMSGDNVTPSGSSPGGRSGPGGSPRPVGFGAGSSGGSVRDTKRSAKLQRFNSEPGKTSPRPW